MECQAKYHKETCPRRCTNARDCQARDGNHLDTCITLCTKADDPADCQAKTHYEDCIKRCISSQSLENPCPATKHTSDCLYGELTYQAHAAKVLAAGKELILMWDYSTLYDVEKTDTGWKPKNGVTVNESLLITKGETLPANGSYSSGDIIFRVYIYRGDEKISTQTVLYKKGTSQTPSMDLSGLMGKMPSFSISGFGGMGGGTSSQTQLYDLTGDVLMTVTSQETMTLTVAVDEFDISSVKTGMSAEITVNALPEEVFEGEITKVAMSGSGNGGSGKFAVEITLPRQGEMLAGMSASAVISLYEKMNVLTLPAAALTEDGAKTIVYTALDKKTGEPTSPVEVTTGLSDGQTVEILSGLKSGDAVYYAYYDTLEESDAVETDRLAVR